MLKRLVMLLLEFEPAWPGTERRAHTPTPFGSPLLGQTTYSLAYFAQGQHAGTVEQIGKQGFTCPVQLAHPRLQRRADGAERRQQPLRWGQQVRLGADGQAQQGSRGAREQGGFAPAPLRLCSPVRRTTCSPVTSRTSNSS